MSVFSDLDIKNGRKDGSIIIEPYNENNVKPASYDVTLGENYYVWNHDHGLDMYNPYNQEHVHKLWKLKRAEYPTEEMINKYGLKKDNKIIIIQPRETILGHTNEFIGSRGNITTQMKCRSSYGRNCITVCKCAGAGDPEWINKWTMEIENCSPLPIFLSVNQRVAQIIFIRTGQVETGYHGSYQHTDDIEQLIKDWKPEMMLPRLKYD